MIHVGGTNGKGSVCAIVANVLHRQGYRVGLYGSPHLQRINERICVNGAEISDKALDSLLDFVSSESRKHLADMDDIAPGEVPLTYFETMTAAAFLHFQRSEVDVAVIEVGLGGRLDATNLVNPVVTAITSIGLEHTEYLGPDIASIAGEKAGILKPGRPTVVGAVPRNAARVIRAIARDRDVPLYIFGEDFQALGTCRSFTWRGPASVHKNLTLGMRGGHQLYNAAVSIAIVDLLPVNLSCEPPAIAEGMSNTHVPGRLEWVAPDLLLDCAHNPEAAQTLAAYLRARPRPSRRTLIMGASSSKDIRGMGVVLAPQVDRVFTTACAHPRAMPPGEVAAALEGLSVPVMPAGHIEEALPMARALGGEVIVAGSIFLSGAVRDLLGLR